MQALQGLAMIAAIFLGPGLALIGAMALVQLGVYQVRIVPGGLNLRRFGLDAGTLEFAAIHEIRPLRKGVTYVLARKFGFMMWFGGVVVQLRVAREPKEQFYVLAAPNSRRILAAWQAWRLANAGPDEADDLSRWL